MNLLNLPDWTVLDVRETPWDYHVSAAYQPEPTACINCGCDGQLYRHGCRDQLMMDVPTHGKRTGVIVQRRRYRCMACKKTFFQPLPHLYGSGTMTNRLVAYIERQALRRTFTSVADDVGVDEATVRNIFAAYVERLDASSPFQTPEWLGIDETVLLKKPRCVLTDVKAGKIIEVLENRNKETVMNFLSRIPDRSRIAVVAMDMWQPYRDAAREILPQATVVVDKFHVVRLATLALEVVRRRVRKSLTPAERRKLVRSRYVLLRRRASLSVSDAELLEQYTRNLPTIGTAYHLKESFCEIWDLPEREEALMAFRRWCTAIPDDVANAFRPIADTLSNWETEVFAYFAHRVTNAATEALNGVAKVINRGGRGYSFKAIRAKMLYRAQAERPPKFVPLPGNCEEQPVA